MYCIAKNDAVLDGLLTVFHAERSVEGLANVQNDLPLLSDYDKECLHILAQDFEVGGMRGVARRGGAGWPALEDRDSWRRICPCDGGDRC